MLKKNIIWLGLLLPHWTWAQNEMAAFIPAGWQIEQTINGDLNGDGRADKVLILLQQDLNKWQDNTGLGAQRLNLNPRSLVVLLRTGQTWQQTVRNDGILPSPNSDDSPCLQDPLADDGISIRNGVLNVNLHYWLSCGSYTVGSNTFRFRYDNGTWPLIGFDWLLFSRNSHYEERHSYNLITGQAISTLNKHPARPVKISNPRLNLHMTDFNQRFEAWQNRLWTVR